MTLAATEDRDEIVPRLVALGERTLVVRFGDQLTDAANRAAIAAAQRLEAAGLAGTLEIYPSLVSAVVTYDPLAVHYADLAAEVRLALSGASEDTAAGRATPEHSIPVRFGGDDGPDLDFVAAALGMNVETFITRHNQQPLRVLATGFAPGFVYCGLHPDDLVLPRRQELHPRAPAGSILFAAGQTAITATGVPTGWHVIGRTDMRNFDPARTPPTLLAAGDSVRFVAEGLA